MHLLLSGLEVDVFGNEDLQEYKLLIRDCRLENEFKTNAIFPILLSTVTCKFNYFLSVFVSRSPRNPRLVN